MGWFRRPSEPEVSSGFRVQLQSLTQQLRLQLSDQSEERNEDQSAADLLRDLNQLEADYLAEFRAAQAGISSAQAFRAIG